MQDGGNKAITLTTPIILLLVQYIRTYVTTTNKKKYLWMRNHESITANKRMSPIRNSIPENICTLQRTLVIMTVFVTKDFAVKSNYYYKET